MRFDPRRGLRDLITVWEQFQRDDGLLMSAAVAYFVGLSLFPLLLVLIAALGLFLRHTNLGQDAEQQLLTLIGENLSPALATQVRQMLEQVQVRSKVGGPIGLITMLATAMAAFGQLERCFDKIWKLPQDNRPGVLRAILRLVVDRGIAFLGLLTLGVFVVLVFVAGFALSWVRGTTSHFLSVPDSLWTGMQVGVTLLLNTLLFSLMFRWLPRAKVGRSEALRGGLLTAILWEVGRQVLAAFLIGTKYSSAYGVVGSFIGVLVWCQYAAMIIFVGAEYVHLIWTRKRTAASQTAAAVSSPKNL